MLTAQKPIKSQAMKLPALFLASRFAKNNFKMRIAVVLCFLLVVALAQHNPNPHVTHHPGPEHHLDGSVLCHQDLDCSCPDSTQTAYCDLSTHRCECRATGKRQVCDHANVCTCADGSSGHCSHEGECHCHHR